MTPIMSAFLKFAQHDFGHGGSGIKPKKFLLDVLALKLATQAWLKLDQPHDGCQERMSLLLKVFHEWGLPKFGSIQMNFDSHMQGRWKHHSAAWVETSDDTIYVLDLPHFPVPIALDKWCDYWVEEGAIENTLAMYEGVFESTSIEKLFLRLDKAIGLPCPVPRPVNTITHQDALVA